VEAYSAAPPSLFYAISQISPLSKERCLNKKPIMAAIFSFDETDEHIPRARRDTVSSINSFEDRWQHDCLLTEDSEAPSRFRRLGAAWDNGIIAEEDEMPSRVGTPPIPIPHAKTEAPRYCSGSVQLDFNDDFVASQVQMEGSLNRKMVPSDFEQVRVLGKGGYGSFRY
jgi:hypothetical protein